MNKEEIEKLAEAYAEEQNSAYTNDMYGFIAGFNKCLELTTPTQPTLSAEEFLKRYHNDSPTDWLFQKRDVVAKLLNEYRNQPVKNDTKDKLAEEISQMSDAEFNKGANELLKLVKPFTPERTPKEEAERIKKIGAVETYKDCVKTLQELGSVLTYEEQVLNELKGM